MPLDAVKVWGPRIAKFKGLPLLWWCSAEAEAVLSGDGHLAFANQVLLNAAVRLHLAGKADSVEQGVYLSKALIDEGKPLALYSKWKELLH